MARPTRLLFLLNAFACAVFIHPAASAAADQPNIVFVMADDVGLGDIGLYHRQRTGRDPVAPTPHLDALATAGMRFSDAHSSTALCSPTRYCVMSGNLNYRSYATWGVWGSFRPTPFTEDDATLGRVAKSAGLATAFIGKWHLGGDFRTAAGEGVYRGNDRGDTPLPVDVSQIVAGGPQSVGFDSSYTLPCGIQGPLYVAYEDGRWSPFHEDSRLIHYTKASALDPLFVSDKGPGMGDSHWDPSRVGPMLSSKATSFIRENATAGRPFFLCYWSPMVHVPHAPPEEFDGLRIRGVTPTRHLDMVLDLDQQIGRMVEALKDTGVYENTLFVFSSDNGGLIDRRGARAGHDSSGGYRGFKNDPHEGGHRVPLFATWPGKIEPGAECHEPVVLHDMVATMAGVLGTRLRPEQAKDSLNLLPLLTGEGTLGERPDLLLQGGNQAVVMLRQGDWKLIIETNRKLTEWKPTELFNLAESPLEPPSENLINSPAHRDRIRQMLARYREIRESGQRTAPLSM
ncbi:MAG: arylsulfatase [Planctomycetota bacterium]